MKLSTILNEGSPHGAWKNGEYHKQHRQKRKDNVYITVRTTKPAIRSVHSINSGDVVHIRPDMSAWVGNLELGVAEERGPKRQKLKPGRHTVAPAKANVSSDPYILIIHTMEKE